MSEQPQTTTALDEAEEVICLADEGATFVIDSSKITLKKGQTCMIPKAYTCLRQYQKNRDPLPSVIELETSKKVLPVSDPRARGVVSARNAQMQQAKK